MAVPGWGDVLNATGAAIYTIATDSALAIFWLTTAMLMWLGFFSTHEMIRLAGTGFGFLAWFVTLLRMPTHLEPQADVLDQARLRGSWMLRLLTGFCAVVILASLLVGLYATVIFPFVDLFGRIQELAQ